MTNYGRCVTRMARKARIKSELGIYHVVLRGERNLFNDTCDFNEFKRLLKEYINNEDTKLYAYSLEKRKIHLVFYVKGEISLIMKPLCTSYARYINRIYKKSGKLFYDRYISEPIDDKKMLSKVIAFVHSYNKDSITSKDEYDNKSEICKIEKTIKSDLTKTEFIYPFKDNYQDMTDTELKNYLLSLNNKKLSKMSKEEKREYAKEILINANLSKTRVEKIFGIKTATVKKATDNKVKEENEQKKEEPIRQKKQELSVWLL